LKVFEDFLQKVRGCSQNTTWIHVSIFEENSSFSRFEASIGMPLRGILFNSFRNGDAEENLQNASKCFAVCPTLLEDTACLIKAVLVTQTIVEG
jgi:hypothetical protein